MSAAEGKKLVDYRVDGGVAVITLDNPPANAYSLAMMRQLDAAILAARFDDAVHVVLITGAGEKFFCAGADIAMLGEVTPSFKYNFCLHANETLARLEQRYERATHRACRARDEDGHGPIPSLGASFAYVMPRDFRQRFSAVVNSATPVKARRLRCPCCSLDARMRQRSAPCAVDQVFRFPGVRFRSWRASQVFFGVIARDFYNRWFFRIVDEPLVPFALFVLCRCLCGRNWVCSTSRV